MTDPVQLALANANRNRGELDALYQRQRQAGQDVIQNANVFSSWSDRAASMEESKRQFDVTQDLRERQLALQQERSAAELAGIKSQQEIQAINLSQAKKALEDAPKMEEARSFFNNAISDVVSMGLTPEQSKARLGEVLKNSPYTSYLKPTELMGLYDGVANAAADNSVSLAAKNYEISNKMILANAINAGVNPKSLYDKDGNFQADVAVTLTEERKRALAQEQSRLKMEEERESVKARTKGQLEVLGAGSEMKDAQGNPLSANAAINAAARYRGAAAKSALGEEKNNLIAQAKRLEDYANSKMGDNAPAPSTTPAGPSVSPSRQFLDQNPFIKVP